MRGPLIAPQFGATDVSYRVAQFGNYRGVLVTYAVAARGETVYGAQAYLDGPQQVVVITVTSAAAATSEADLMHIADTIRFG